MAPAKHHFPFKPLKLRKTFSTVFNLMAWGVQMWCVRHSLESSVPLVFFGVSHIDIELSNAAKPLPQATGFTFQSPVAKT